MSLTSEQIEAGQAVYTRRNLRLYDFVVMGLSNRWAWKCPAERLIAHYDRHVSGNHLDVGVGTGYLLDHCRFPVPAPRVALMDLNSETLAFAGRRIARYSPEVYRRNALEPIAFDGRRFDSVGLNYLLHCLPGSMEVKAAVFDHLRPLMNPGGVIFGSTLLHGGVERNRFARGLMSFYNRKGIFSNREDDLERLQRALEKRFSNVSVEVVGCAALFAAKVPEGA